MSATNVSTREFIAQNRVSSPTEFIVSIVLIPVEIISSG